MVRCIRQGRLKGQLFADGLRQPIAGWIHAFEVIRIAQEKGPAAGFDAATKRKKGVDLIERRINDKGYDLLGGGKRNEAIAMFELGVIAFPKSANAFDSLGEAYMEAGNKKLAIENYEKSLKLDADNKNGEEMSKKLRQ
jgi:tetratricopeptide (TPR) repeat protein